MIELKIFSLKDTENFANLLAKVIIKNMVISFVGDLGAGKTTIIRNILKNMGISGSIKSPTFTIVEPYYVNDINIYHFDLYRFDDESSWYDLGFDDYFINNYLCFIEWAEKAKRAIPKIDITIQIIPNNEYRKIILLPETKWGIQCLKNLAKIVGNF
jgi:tRNA threonylcarbamoyladenosine biosynthesis protein TsaE